MIHSVKHRLPLRDNVSFDFLRLFILKVPQRNLFQQHSDTAARPTKTRGGGFICFISSI
jgi:hypothetical protein